MSNRMVSQKDKLPELSCGYTAGCKKSALSGAPVLLAAAVRRRVQPPQSLLKLTICGCARPGPPRKKGAVASSSSLAARVSCV